MLFTQSAFIFLFLPFFLVLYFNKKLNALITTSLLIFLASLFFHAFFSLNATLILVASTVVNYYFLDKVYNNKRNIIIAISLNLLVLIYFKYSFFLVGVVNSILGTHFRQRIVTLPLGISFFTFTQIACLIGAYKTHFEKKNFFNYGAFVSFFPHLIAGPIIHYQPMVTQFLDDKNKYFDRNNFICGLHIFCIGLAKKLILADTIATIIDPIFENIKLGVDLSTSDAWICSIGYTFQLYYDFSGYSDMAIGISRMFNIHLPANFNAPYIATSIIDFWRRWHITLSTFLRDYLYIPLGGNRKGALYKYLSIFITMLLGGLWHGAGYTFLLWGIYHGVGLIVNHIVRDFKIFLNTPKIIGWLVTFLFVINGWVLFRSPDISTAYIIYKAMYGFNGFSPFISLYSTLYLLSCISCYFIYCLFKRDTLTFKFQSGSSEILSILTGKQVLFLLGILFSISIIMAKNESPFLYFQF